MADAVTAPRRPAITVVVAAGIRLYREGLSALLGAHPSIEVVGTAASLTELHSRVSAVEPDVVLLDMELPDSLAAIRSTRGDAGAPFVIAIGMPDSDDGVVDCLEAGAAGYVPRHGSVDEVLARVEAAQRGEVACSPSVAGRLARRVATLVEQLPDPHPHATLTAREREIAALVEAGMSNKEIASTLCIELSTVKNHVHNILEKLGISRRGQVATGIRHGKPGTSHAAR